MNRESEVKGMSRKNSLVFLLVLILVMGFTATVVAHLEKPEGEYVTLVDENNKVIHYIAHEVYVGDEYISRDNIRYKVVEVKGDTAKCINKGIEKLPEIAFNQESQSYTFDALPVVNTENKTVAVYVTHSDESYVPTDGTESIKGEGGIYDVADVFVKQLEANGFNVIYSEDNHNPHDINAYNRSRKTAVNLLKQNPVAIFDVHRDAVPAEQYETDVEGKAATKIKLVIGRTNPNSKTNLEYAKRIKAVMDKEKPGLSNGIFMGKGDYNQDLSPRAILIEVGSHENSKEEAVKGVKEFADVIPAVLGAASSDSATEPAKKPAQSGDNQGAGTTIAIILIVVAVAVGGFYLLNKGPGNG